MKTSKYRHPGVVAIYFCVLVLSTSIRLAYAQTSDQGWTLEQMLERALETSPDVHEALADELVSASQLGRAKAGRLPTASSRVTTGTSTDGESSSPGGNDSGNNE